MKNLRFAVPVLLLAAANLFANDVPRGTKVTVRTSTMVSSDRSLLGEAVDLTLVDDLVVNGKVIAPSGTVARGVISDARPSRPGKVDLPGSISIRLETIDTSKGIYRLSTNEYTRQGRGRSRSPISPGPGGGVSIDSVGGVKVNSPVPSSDPAAATLASGGLEAMIPPQSVITFKINAMSSPDPSK